MARLPSEQPPHAELAAALEVPVDDGLLQRALTHRSYAYEQGGLPTNERLEFLGDAVLGLVVTDGLYRSHPDLPEGQLAKLRASVVNMRALASVARSLGSSGMGRWLLLGRGEEATGGRNKASILADTLEALIGAVYLSDGLEVAAELVHRLFDPLMADAAGRGAGLDWKTSLQELTASRMLGPPDYTMEEAGPDHAKRFTARAVVAGQELGRGEGGSKKEAEQRAAETAFAAVQARILVAAAHVPGDRSGPSVGADPSTGTGMSSRADPPTGTGPYPGTDPATARPTGAGGNVPVPVPMPAHTDPARVPASPPFVLGPSNDPTQRGVRSGPGEPASLEATDATEGGQLT